MSGDFDTNSNVSDHDDDYSIQTLLNHLSASIGMITPKSMRSRIPVESESELDNDEQCDLTQFSNDQNDSFGTVFSEDFVQYFDEKMKQLDQIWPQMDLDIDEQREKIQKLKDELMETVDSFVEAEHESFHSYEERIASLEQNIATKLEQMIRHMPEKDLCEIFKTSSMKEANSKCEQLEQILETLDDHQNRHLAEVNRLQKALKTLMEKLGVDQTEFEHLLNAQSLTATEMENLGQEIVRCESDLGNRKNDCDRTVKMIGFLVELIPWELNNPFCSENFHWLDGNYCLVEGFIYSDSNLKILNNHHENLVKQFQYHGEMIRQKFDQLQQICKLLDLEPPNTIHSNHSITLLVEQGENNLQDSLEIFYANRFRFQDQNLQQVLYELATEYENCEQMKSERMETIIGNLRKQYFELLEKCLADVDLLLADPKFGFLLDNTNYDSDLFELHEKELKKLQAYYEKYEEFFTLSSKRMELEEKMAQAERKSTEIYKLKNRGGIMLKFVNEKRNNKKQLSQIKQQLQTWFQNEMLNSDLDDNHGELSLGYYRLNLQCEDILCQLQEPFGECKFAWSLKSDHRDDVQQSNDET